jgi:superfamily I DNA/RNA helicase
LDSVLLIYDHDGGYRRFLGADPDSAYTLKPLCPVRVETDQSFVISKDMAILGNHLYKALNRSGDQKRKLSPLNLEADILEYAFSYFYPEMLDWVADQVAGLVNEEGVPPGEIVILSPFINDALRFGLEERLGRRAVPVRTHRPSRSLREEAITRCLLTIAALAHPQWGVRPSLYEFAYMLVQIIAGLDLVRAQLLAQTVFRSRADQLSLSSYDLIKPEMQERITYRVGELYEGFRRWLEEYASSDEEELDYFFSRLFGELLSQPGYTFHVNYYAGEITANLIESIRKFRWIADRVLTEKGVPAGKEYLQMVQDGVISALYIRSWQIKADDAVLIAPAYTFLMRNTPVDYQFWLDIGSRGWFERLYQPLTHPYVLSRSWRIDRTWTDTDEIETGEEALYRLALGLIRRCRKKIYLGLSELSEQGYENRGPLLRAIDRVLRHAN